jgi:hypothetical protein
MRNRFGSGAIFSASEGFRRDAHAGMRRAAQRHWQTPEMHVTRKQQVLARTRTDHEGRDGQHPSTGRTSTHARTHAHTHAHTHTHTHTRMADAYNRRLHKRTRARTPNSTADRESTHSTCIPRSRRVTLVTDSCVQANWESAEIPA